MSASQRSAAEKTTDPILFGYQDNQAMISTIASMGCQPNPGRERNQKAPSKPKRNQQSAIPRFGSFWFLSAPVHGQKTDSGPTQLSNLETTPKMRIGLAPVGSCNQRASVSIHHCWRFFGAVRELSVIARPA
jgi:hypothetical protein